MLLKMIFWYLSTKDLMDDRIYRTSSSVDVDNNNWEVQWETDTCTTADH